jgi:hypothetical protein
MSGWSLWDAVPYAAAWLALGDPETRRHRPVGQSGDTEFLARYFALPEADDEVERLGLDRFRPPVRAGGLPVPLPETRAWGEYLLPAGFRDGVVVGLFTGDGRHVWFLGLLSDERDQPTTAYIHVVGSLRPLFARALDRMPSLAALAESVGDAEGGAVLTRAGRVLAVPGLPPHALLAAGSPVVAEAHRHVGTAGAHATFLSPSAAGLVRVTVLDCRDETADHLTGLVLVRAAGDLAGLAPADLELLGALLEGWDDEDINARCEVTHVAAHTDELAGRLGDSSTHALLVHVARAGLYVPPPLWPGRSLRTPAERRPSGA